MKRVLIGVFIVISFFSENAKTQTLNPSNGHYYELISIPPNYTWHQCRDSSLALGGYLVTITSQEEQDFLHPILVQENTNICFIGGTDEISEGNWEWVTGEPFSFSYWRPNEPSNTDSGEDYIAIVVDVLDTWNDTRDRFEIPGFFMVEYNAIDTVILSFEEHQHVVNHTPDISWTQNGSNLQTTYNIEIGTDNDWGIAEMWNPAPIISADTFITYNGSPLIDGETYYGRLRVSNGTSWSEWFEFSFRMNSPPSIPVTLSPIDYVETNSTPTLWIENSFDAEGDSLFYDFSGNKNNGSGVVYEPLLAGDKVPEGIDSTSLEVMAPLEENSICFWEVRAYDGYEYSDWTVLLESSFWVNETNEAPLAPSAMTPNEFGSPLYILQPNFVWSKSIDPDQFDTLRYKLHLAIDSNFNFETVIDSIPHGNLAIPQIYYQFSFPLESNEHYWWKVDVFDNHNSFVTSDVRHFWTSCCSGIRGNVDSDVLDVIDISDLVFLVDFMFTGGSAPLCLDEANVDGDAGNVIDISDLVMLVDYMFTSGPEPAVCP